MTDFLWIGLGGIAAVLIGVLAGYGLMAEIAQVSGRPSAVHGCLCLGFALGVSYLILRGWMSLGDEQAPRRKTMSKSSGDPGPSVPLKVAEVIYLNATTKPIADRPKSTAIAGVKQTVTLRIDQDVLDFFQKDGRGWQDRVNAALQKVAGKPHD